MNIRDNMVVVFERSPAWAFAKSAREWYEKIPEPPPPDNLYNIGEPARLVFLYSCLSLEAFIAEELVSRTSESQYGPLFERGVPITVRWRKAARLCACETASAQRALENLVEECKDTKNYGLMVRARNKLVHPKVHKEILDDRGYIISDSKIERLVADLQKPPANLPDDLPKPSFPRIIECGDSAKWSLQTLSRMIRLFYNVVDESISDHWKDVLM